MRDLAIMITSASKSQHVNIVLCDDVDDSKVVEDVCVPSEITSDVVNALVESSTPIPSDIYVHEDDTSESEYVLVESSMLIQVALATPMIGNKIKHEIIATSVVTFSKPSESSSTKCQIHAYL